MKPFRIVIASPSPIERSRLAKIVGTHPQMSVIAQATDLSETYTLSEAMEPDVVLLAFDYTRTPEFACMKSLFYALNTRWLVIGGPGTARAPQRASDPAYPAVSVDMVADRILDIIREVQGMRAAPGRSLAAGATRPPPRLQQDRLILIGASTGGVDALLTVLANFPADCPPTAIVQHTGQGFSDSLIRLLDRRCAAQVLAAQDGVTLQAGRVCVAAGTAGHFRLTGRPPQCRITAGEPVSGHVPSVDELFRSALPLADRVAAALLTGMGRDGADGLLALRRAGARTIAQDEASSIVYGMPRAAADLGAVEQQLRLDRIGPELLRLCAREAEVRVVSR